MRKLSRGIVLALVASFLALGLAVYGASVSPADAPPTRTVSTALASARFFALLPDDRVEITDAWGRRVFEWDGQKWSQIESRALPRPDSPYLPSGRSGRRIITPRSWPCLRP